MSSLKSTFTLTHFPDERKDKKIKFHFSFFMDDTIGLIITIGKKEYRMVTFTNIKDFQDRGAGFGLKSEDILFTSRILQQI